MFFTWVGGGARRNVIASVARIKLSVVSEVMIIVFVVNSSYYTSEFRLGLQGEFEIFKLLQTLSVV